MSLRYDTRIQLVRQTETVGADGTPSAGSTVLAEVWAQLDNVKQSEDARAGVRTMRFTVRHSPTTAAIETRDSIHWRGVHYAIESMISEPPSRPDRVVFTASTSSDSLPA